MAERSKHPAGTPPRAIIHKKILDVAEDDPRASVEAIANQIGGATNELVTKVLEEYGDPSADDTDSMEELSGDGGQAVTTESEAVDFEAQASTSSTDETNDDQPDATGETSDDQIDVTDESGSSSDAVDSDRSVLSESQIETLRSIRRDPEATQQEIADELDVVRATVSNRVNDIDGFDWQRRLSFVENFFEGDSDNADQDLIAPASETTETPTGPDNEDQEAEKESMDQTETAAESEASVTDDGRSGETFREDDDGDEELPVESLISIEDRLAGLESTIMNLETAVDERRAESESDENDTGESEAQQNTPAEETCVDDPELMHKALQAILEDDRITEAEEMQLLRQLL